MEKEFLKTTIPGYRMALCQVQTKEVTQDLRLPDAEADIGNVIGCWGQIMLRSKEWQHDGVSVSGGVMVWVLYMPENGGIPAQVETWIPFQMKWDLKDVENDGSLLICPLVKSVDARNVSARKLVIRANISISAQAMEPTEMKIYQPEQLPEDILLRKERVPMEIPVEVGELAFQIDEELAFPEGKQSIHKLIHYNLEPIITENRVLSDKLLFRGKLKLGMLYLSQDGEIHNWDSEIGFSKYTQLRKEYDGNCQVRLLPVLTGAELDIQENRILWKVSIVAQYILYDRIILETVSDAYSPLRDVGIEKEALQATARLDTMEKEVQWEQSSHIRPQRIVNVTAYHGHPSVTPNGDLFTCEIDSCCQVLYIDEDGTLQSQVLRSEAHFQIPSDQNNQHCLYGELYPKVEMLVNHESMGIHGAMTVQCDTICCGGRETVSALRLGDTKEPDPARPSVIIRKMSGEQLWDLAKACGSSVTAIQQINHLQEEPQPGQMLLIPVL